MVFAVQKEKEKKVDLNEFHKIIMSKLPIKIVSKTRYSKIIEHMVRLFSSIFSEI